MTRSEFRGCIGPESTTENNFHSDKGPLLLSALSIHSEHCIPHVYHVSFIVPQLRLSQLSLSIYLSTEFIQLLQHILRLRLILACNLRAVERLVPVEISRCQGILFREFRNISGGHNPSMISRSAFQLVTRSSRKQTWKHMLKDWLSQSTLIR